MVSSHLMHRVAVPLDPAQACEKGRRVGKSGQASELSGVDGLPQAVLASDSELCPLNSEFLHSCILAVPFRTLNPEL